MIDRRMPAGLALAFAAFIGVLTAVQARINGQLGLRLGDGLVAALISFGSGLVILVMLSAALPSGRAGFARLLSGVRSGGIPWWMLLGGVAGALTVATQGLVVAIIGVSLFTVGLVAGQTVSGLILDRVGLGPGGPVAVTLPRVAGGALALAAVALSLSSGGFAAAPWWMLILPVLTGLGVAWQQAVNGRLRQRVGTPLTATLMNFVTGTTVLAVAAAVHVALVGPPAPLPTEPWLYLGGPLGVVYILVSAAIVAYTGVLLLGLCAITGQLIASFVIDLLWPAAASAGIAMELTVVTIALASVVVAVLPWRRR